jgi:hypothetical protein
MLMLPSPGVKRIDSCHHIAERGFRRIRASNECQEILIIRRLNSAPAFPPS